MAYLKTEQLAGMNSHYMYYPFDYFLDVQEALGLKTIELWCGAPHYLMDNHGWQDTVDLKHRVEAHGLRIGVFTPESTNYNYLICSPDSIIQKNTFDYYTNAMKAASEIGAPILPIRCCGGAWNEEKDLIFDRAVCVLRKLAPAAADLGVTLAVETVCPQESCVINTLPELKALLDAVSAPSVKACLDLTAAGVAGETMEQWFETFGQNICHIHFVDGRPQGRLIWGDGLRPLEDCLRVLNDNHYEGFLGLHTFDGRYLADPKSADQRNITAFQPFFK